MTKQPMIPCAFSFMLLEFNELVAEMPTISKVKDKLLALKKDAEINHELNGRQREAITERIKFYLSGEYGNTKSGVTMKS